MKVEEAKTKVCPFMSNWIQQGMNLSEFKTSKCIIDSCMFWINTVKGKKEVNRKRIPYDIYPTEEGQLRRQLEKDGYEQAGTNYELRSIYIKYEESHEGYCSRIGQ